MYEVVSATPIMLTQKGMCSSILTWTVVENWLNRV